MKKFFVPFAALAFSFVLLGCPVDVDPPPGGTGQFWAENMVTGAFYQVTAEKLATGARCVIWGEKSAGVSAATATSIALTYDNNIYQKMLYTFGMTGNFTSGGVVVAHNTLEIADWLGDGDGKLAILLLDIKDGYTPGNGYVAGYFWAGNFFNIQNSNKMDMMYVDAYPGVPGSVQSNTTFAHELQHLMNFTTSNVRRTSPMDTWIDEGLATAAEYVYLAPGHDVSRIDYFTADWGNYIKNGNNFFVWGNHETGNSYATLGDYSTAYLFFQWLRLQSGGTGIYKDIITSTYSDYRAVTTAARVKMGESGYTDDAAGWGLILRDWMAANYIKSATSRYGYKDDSTINSKLNVTPLSGGGPTVPLAPGEGVYSSVSSGSYTIPGAGGTVKYAGLNSPAVADSGSVSAGGKLLTYNVNTNKSGGMAYGTVTGAASIIPGGVGSVSLSLSMSQPSAPFAIGAQDMLRRHGHGDWGNPNFGDMPLVEIDAAD